MGIINDVFSAFSPKPKKRQEDNLTLMNTLNGTSPIYSQFGKNIYSSDVVQQALNCIVQEMKKLIPRHITISNGIEEIAKRTDINAVLANPNELMTTSDFIEKIVWLLFFNYNVFIYPSYSFYTDRNGDRKKFYTGLYPLNPTQVEFLQD